MASKILSSSAHLGCQTGLSSQGLGGGRAGCLYAALGLDGPGCTQGPSLPKDHFRGGLSLGVSSKGVSEWERSKASV